MRATLTRETAALSRARHFWEMCLINSGRQREQSRAPRSTARSRRVPTSWRKRELKPAVPQVTGRCRDHGMRLLLLLALPASRGISQFSLIHLEMSIHSIATTSWWPASITKCWNLLQRKNQLGPSLGLDWLLVDVEWFPLRFLTEDRLAGFWNAWMSQSGSYDRFTPGSVSVLYSKWLGGEKYCKSHC